VNFLSINESFFEGLKKWLEINSISEVLIKMILIYVTFFWVALIIWSTRDIINRTNNIFFQIFAILLNTLLPIFGLVIYLLIRPNKTLLDKYYDELEIKAFIDNNNCNKCSSVLKEEHCFCPQCGETIKTECIHCHQFSLLDYIFCPLCGDNKTKKKAVKKKVIIKKVKEPTKKK
jgi:RNA polymerase subunit RPABC4/transcription elongation factor Spt4